MANVTFTLKDPKTQGETAINLMFRYAGTRVKIGTGKSINPVFWNKQTCKAKNTKAFPEHMDFNHQLDTMRKQAVSVYEKYKAAKNNEPATSTIRQLIKATIHPDKVKKMVPQSFLEFFSYFIDHAPKRTNPKTGKPISKARVQTLKQTLTTLHDFQKTANYILEWDTINLEFYEQYKEFLTEREYSLNTIGKFIRALKTVLNDAAARNINNNYSYKSKRFAAPSQQNPAIYLNENELTELYKLDLSKNNRLDKARDLFLIGCWTGLRFSDWGKVNEKNIDGDYLAVEAEKTGKKVTVPIHPTVKAILEKYNNNLPPNISNQKMNKFLKELGEMFLTGKEETTITRGGKLVKKIVNKWELLTTHTARRSFATNLYNRELDTITIMAVTGHSKEADFYRYIRTTPKDHAKKIRNNWNEPTLKMASNN